MSAQKSIVYLQVSVGGVDCGQIAFRLYDHVAPIASDHFRQVCRGSFGYTYRGVPFHSVRGGALIGGDVLHRNGSANFFGYGGQPYVDEPNTARHTGPGFIGVHKTPQGNGSQFYITLGSLPHMDGASTIFGEIAFPTPLLQTLQSFANINGVPPQPIIITACGEMV